MSAIITPELVRRYLKATGWTRDQRGVWWNARVTVGLHSYPWDGRDLPRLSEVAGETGEASDRELVARLGMLAAAEMLRASFEANWAPGENTSVERFVSGEIRGMIYAAGVDPDAWEAAR